MNIGRIGKESYLNRKIDFEKDFTVFCKLTIWSATALSLYSTPIVFINSLAIGTLLAMNFSEGVDRPTHLFSFKTFRLLMAAELVAVTSISRRNSLKERIAVCVALILFSVYLPVVSSLVIGQYLGAMLYYRGNNHTLYQKLFWSTPVSEK